MAAGVISLRRSPPWLMSTALHALLVGLGLWLALGKLPPPSAPLEMVVVDSPRAAPRAIEIAKPKPKEEVKTRQVFGVSRKALTAADGLDVKAGNTLAKAPDHETLKDSDPDSLPIPSEDYLVTEMPRLEQEVIIPYPPEVKKRGVQGAVTMDLLIDATGRVRKVDLVDGPDPQLSAAAVTAAAQFKFRPAYIKDKPVAVKIRYAYRFVIRG